MFYIKDQTINKMATYRSYPEVVRHLEGTVQRLNKQTRAQYMNDMVALGHGYDDVEGVQFVKLMSEAVNIGIVRDGNPIRCDITNIAMFSQPEYGD